MSCSLFDNSFQLGERQLDMSTVMADTLYFSVLGLEMIEGLSKVAVPVLSDCKTIVPLLLSELDIVNCLLLGNVRLDPELITILPTVVFAVNETPALLLIVRLFRLAGSSTDDVCDDEPLYSNEAEPP